jgi:hypothetical protein
MKQRAARLGGAGLAIGLTFGLTFGLGGCAPNSTYGQYWQAMKQAFAGGFGNGSVDRATAAKIPYASIGYRIGGGRQQILVLATDTAGQLLWTAASHVVLVTRGGRIVRSVGLPSDIAALNAQRGEAIPPLKVALEHAYSSGRVADFPDRNLFGAAFSCVTVSKGPASVEVLGAMIATVRVDETCSGESGRFTNNYWLDPHSGLVWRSVQYLDPASDPVEIELFRPPA